MSKKRQKPRKKQGTSRRQASPFGRRAIIRAGGSWPLRECLIAADWREPGQIVQAAVVRQSPETGYIVVGGFLIDLGCLGIKNALTAGFNTEGEYRREYRDALMASQPMKKCSLDLVAKVIAEATAYAAGIGFKPHRDSRDALKVLGEAHPENCDETVPVGGEDGQPMFVAGPYDNVDRILRILDRNVGEGNYHYMFPIGDSSFFEDEFEE